MDELRKEVGVKKSAMKKVVRIRLTWGVHMKNWQRDQMSRKWRGKGWRENDSIKGDIDRMGEEWRNRAIDRKN